MTKRQTPSIASPLPKDIHLSVLILLSATLLSCSALSRSAATDPTQHSSKTHKSSVRFSPLSPRSSLQTSPPPFEVITPSSPGSIGFSSDTEGSNAEGNPSITPEIIPGSQLFTYPGHRGEITALEVSEDGSSAYSAGQDGRVVRSTIIHEKVENKGGGKLSRRPKVKLEVLFENERPIFTIKLSPDERNLAIAQFSSVSILDLDTMAISSRMTRIRGQIRALAWSPDSSLLALGKTNGEIAIWHLANSDYARRNDLRAIDSYTPVLSPVQAIAFHHL